MLLITVPALFLAFLVAITIVHELRAWLKIKRLPEGIRPLPGPKGLPFIGRVHDVPEETSWLKFYEWSKTYGPIYQMEIFGTVHVWISSERIAHDLLSKRNAIYSDRPLIPNLPDNRTSGDYLALLGRTETWKRQRKLCHNLMAASATASLHNYPTLERDRFLACFASDPARYIEWIEQFTARTVSRLAWGSPHPSRLLRTTTAGLLETISPAGALPNVLGFLRFVPAALSPWKKKEAARHRLEAQLFEENVSFVESQPQQQPSFVNTFLQEKAREQQAAGTGEKPKFADSDRHEAMYTVGLMAIAGALTIGSPIQSYLLAMCHYPNWQRQLQDEIDRQCPDGRCPAWEDRAKLPLLRAVVKEVLRWRPPVPTGIPHALEQDDVYEGYFIPAGATIHALEWGITRDESVYPDPETFNPARWLNGDKSSSLSLQGYSQFGFGRRTCQGVPIVEQDLFLAMGGLAWAFDVRKKMRHGAEVAVPWNEYTPLLIAKPAPFEFDAVVRGGEEKRAEIARMGWVGGDGDEEELVVAEDGSLRIEVRFADGSVTKEEEDNKEDSESDHDVLIDVRESSSEPSEKDMAVA